MPKKFDIISIGDSTHDTFVEIDEARIITNKNTKKKELCISWADKIPALKVTQVPGVGNSANAAVGASRQGLKTAIRTHIGGDIIAKSIKENFKKEGVSTRFIEECKNKPSNYSVVINYGAERTILVHHERWKYDLDDNLCAKWFYYSSLGPSHSKLHRQIAKYAKSGVKVAFQPGTYQLRESENVLKPVLKSSEVILLNVEEAQMMTGVKGRNPVRIMKALRARGPKIVVMTDGQDGAYAHDGERSFFVKAYPPNAIERTGAGDSFSIGFVGALIKEKTIEEALLWGNANATSVVQYVGAQEGLLSESGIKKMIRKYKAIRPREI